MVRKTISTIDVIESEYKVCFLFTFKNFIYSHFQVGGSSFFKIMWDILILYILRFQRIYTMWICLPVFGPLFHLLKCLMERHQFKFQSAWTDTLVKSHPKLSISFPNPHPHEGNELMYQS